MKRRTLVLIALIVCFLAFGCAPARHVMILPLDDDVDLEALEVEKPGLEGKWLLDRNSEVWEFGSDKAGNVILKINGTGEIIIYFFEYSFGQVMLTYVESMAEDSGGLSLPLAGLFLVRMNVQEMILMEIDPKWLERLSMEDPEEGWSRRFGDRIFMISIETIDRLLREHGDDPDAFRRYGILRPLKGSQQ